MLAIIQLHKLPPRYSVETYPETMTHATCQEAFSYSRLSSLSHLWTDHGIKGGISVGELISTLKKKGGGPQARDNGRTLSQNPRKRGKSQHQHSAL